MWDTKMEHEKGEVEPYLVEGFSMSSVRISTALSLLYTYEIWDI